MTTEQDPKPEAAPESVPQSAADLQATLEQEIFTLQSQLNDAQAAVNAAKDAQLRAVADAENRVRRAEREAGNSVKFAAESLLKDLLPVADSLELGIKAAGADPEGVAKSLVEGKAMTLNKLVSVLEKHGVKAVDPVGAPFNAELHQAMSMIPAGEVPANHVANVLQKGYTLHERLLRPALVIVAQG